MDHGEGYQYGDETTLGHHCAYLMPPVLKAIGTLDPVPDRKVFDLGCGNGSVAAVLAEKGYDVTGVDPSISAIKLANAAHPELKLYNGSAYDDLAGRFGTFPVVISLEVVEHVYAPREFAKTLYALVSPGGMAIVSTPYHGYFKNITLAVSGKMDAHFTALWDHGHIKFWSVDTLGKLLHEASFEEIRFERIGRIPPLAKSMLAVAWKRKSHIGRNVAM